MADRPRGYGLTRETSDKIAAKYDLDQEKVVTEWMNAIINDKPASDGREAVHAWLKNGQVLCALMNAIQPGSCKKPHNTENVKISAMRKNKEMENISFYLTAAEKYGVPTVDLFQTVDLYENQNMASVLSCLYKLSSVSMKNGYVGPRIGTKISSENKRDFDEQKLREGRNVIGLQMGTNQVASQGGMTPYGLGRQLTPQGK